MTSGQASIKLRLSKEMLRSLPQNMSLSGRHVSVTGRYLSPNTFSVEKWIENPDANVVPLKDQVNTASTAKPYVTILAKFADKTTEPHPKTWYDNLFGNGAQELNAYFSEQSYSTISLNGSLVVGWVTLPQNQAYYVDPTSPTSTNTSDYTKVLTDAMTAVDGQIDWRNYAGANVVTNTVNGSGGGLGGRITLTFDGVTKTFGGTVNNPTDQLINLLAHEMGHSFGMDHSAGPYNTAYDSRWDQMSGGSNWLNNHPIYQTLPVHTNAYHRMRLGWMPGNRIYNAFPGSNQVIRLQRLASPGTTDYAAARIFKGGSEYFTVEARKVVGNFEKLGNTSTGLPGESVVIHDVDEFRVVTNEFDGSSVRDRNSRVVDLDNDGDPNDSGTSASNDAQWKVGEKFTDTSTGISVEVIASGSTYFDVRVIVPSTVPSPNWVTNTNDSGSGSLRSALFFVSKFPELATTRPVSFRIPTTDPGYSGGAWTIKPLTSIELETNDIVLDGTTQTTFAGNTNASGPEIALDGSAAGSNSFAFIMSGSNNTLRGVTLMKMKGPALWIHGSKGGGANNKVYGCFIGVNPQGTAAAPSAQNLVAITDGANSNIIGANTASDRNLISGSTAGGVSIYNSSKTNRIVGNWIGLNSAGTNTIPSTYSGINIGSGSSGNIVELNTVSGNGGGIQVYDTPSVNNQILNNKVGVNPSGTSALGNAGNGIAIINTSGCTVSGNLCSGNTHGGILVYQGASSNLITNNIVGLNAAGTAAIPNQGNGISIIGSNNNTVSNNVSSGNGYDGILIYEGASSNTVIGNTVGLNAAGSAAIGNNNGISVLSEGTSSNIIGGDTAAKRNIVSGNRATGIYLADQASQNSVIGNWIGLSKAGTTAIGNTFSGVTVQRKAVNNIVGGTASGHPNVICGNGGDGISIWDSETSGNQFINNYIGVTPSGTLLKNTNRGVIIGNGPTLNTLKGNIIPGHSNGVLIYQEAGKSAPTGNNIEANSIWNSQYVGIDLVREGASWGADTNDDKDPDLGGNNGQNYPVLTSASRTSSGIRVIGNLNSTPNRSFRIDFFACDTSHSSGYGEGQRFLGSKTVSTNSSGNASITADVNTAEGTVVSSTATDLTTKDTSEFSQTVSIPNGLVGLSVSPTEVNAGQNATGTVTLATTAQGSFLVNLSSTHPSVASVPASATVSSGTASKTFTISTSSVGGDVLTTITASAGGVTKTATLLVKGFQAPPLQKITVNPVSVIAGNKTTATIWLVSAAPGDISVQLTDNSPYVETPASVIVPSGSTSASVQVPTLPRTVTTVATLTATLGSVSKTASLTMTPSPYLSSLGISPKTVYGGWPVTGTLNLASPAPAPVRINTSDNKDVATTPASVVIVKGVQSANFTVTTVDVTANTAVTVTAEYAGVIRTNTFSILPAPQLTRLTMNPTNIKGGLSSVGTVLLSRTAPAGGIVVNLSDNATYTTTPASVTVPSGQLSATFSVTSVAVTVKRVITITSSYKGVIKTATLTLSP